MKKIAFLLCSFVYIKAFASPEITKLDNLSYPYTLAKLPYEYSALEPIIDTRTMHLHHDHHHKTYLENFHLKPR